MKFNERIRELRIDANKSQKEVAEYLNNIGITIGSYTISKWEAGVVQPSINQFIALCDFYGVRDIRYAFSGVKSIGAVADLLEGLNKEGKARAQEYIDMLRNNPKFSANNQDYEESEPPLRTIKLFSLPASAGTGLYLDSEDYEEMTVDDSVPSNTSYALRISGDSMEPQFEDEQIIYVHEQNTLHDGEIGIFVVNSDVYCKKLMDGKLISLNKKYNPITISEYDSFYILGKVLG